MEHVIERRSFSRSFPTKRIRSDISLRVGCTQTYAPINFKMRTGDICMHAYLACHIVTHRSTAATFSVSRQGSQVSSESLQKASYADVINGK